MGRLGSGPLAAGSVRPFLYLARYRQKTNTTVAGVSKSGEVSPKGVVAHTEDWEGRIAATAAPAGIHYIRDPDGTIRKMTFKELVDHGYFIVGRGPTGVRVPRKGIQ